MYKPLDYTVQSDIMSKKHVFVQFLFLPKIVLQSWCTKTLLIFWEIMLICVYKQFVFFPIFPEFDLK